MLVNKDFQTWLLAGWQHSCQPARSQVWKSFLINIEFNIECISNLDENFLWPALSQCLEMIENANTFLCFLKWMQQGMN